MKKQPKTGDVILVRAHPAFSASGDVVWVEAEVESELAVQFTARLLDDTGTLTYRFYHDYGDSWKWR